jgi:TatD DNase family protein
MIDTHCHLTDPRLASQLEDVLSRGRAAGVTRFITIGTGLADDEAAIALCRGRPDVRCAIGVHPNYSHEAAVSDLPRLRELQRDPSVLALGEMGLDYHHHFAPIAQQYRIFEPQLQLATELSRPVVIHCREATDDCLAVMRQFPSIRAVFHCFTGSPDEARKILDAGHWLGFTGAITFKKNDALRKAVALTPPDRMLVETDAPYLTPEPHRAQKTNEPAMVVHVAATVARVKGMSVEEVDRVTTQNASRFFSWPPPEPRTLNPKP